MHPDLKYAGMLPPLDAPHHLRATEWFAFREGVVRKTDMAAGHSFIDVGLELVSMLFCVCRPTLAHNLP